MMNRGEIQVMKIAFTKMHGASNDYIYFDCTKEPGLTMLREVDLPSLSERLSDRRRQVGGDGIILVCPSEVADVRMRIFNADGSEAEMCGNGIRCVGKCVYDQDIVEKDILTIEAGVKNRAVKILELQVDEARPVGDQVTGATVDMGRAEVELKRIPAEHGKLRFDQGEYDAESAAPEPFREDGPFYTAGLLTDGEVLDYTLVSMGNPHAVTFLDGEAAGAEEAMDELMKLDLPKIGPQIDFHPFFPERTNTEYVKLIGRKEVSMRVWERGSGETFACGTGACAVAVASMLTGRCDGEVLVHLRGGDLLIRRDEQTGHIFMTGPAETAFHGTVEI